MAGTTFILAGVAGALGVWVWDLRKKVKKGPEATGSRQRVSNISSDNGTTRIWQVE